MGGTCLARMQRYKLPLGGKFRVFGKVEEWVILLKVLSRFFYKFITIFVALMMLLMMMMYCTRV
jgi:hypothetical protein